MGQRGKRQVNCAVFFEVLLFSSSLTFLMLFFRKNISATVKTLTTTKPELKAATSRGINNYQKKSKTY
jgi:hypothetical protein